MPSIPQPRRGKNIRASDVKLVNPAGSVTEVMPNLIVAHEPAIEGMSWEEHVKKSKTANPNGVVIDLDTIVESERPMATFNRMIMETSPNCSRAIIMLHADIIFRIVERNTQEKHKKAMEELNAKIQEKEEEMVKLREENRKLREPKQK